jgi:hypothetical protein
VKPVVSLLALAFAAYAAVAGLMYAFQPKLLYFPMRALVATPQAAGMDYESVTLRTEDGVALHGWFVPAEGARGTLLFFHGNAGNISHRLDSLAIFHRLGLSTLIVDYRGYGQSEGKPTEEGTYLDAEAAWRHLTETRGIAPERVVVFGRSLGGAVAAHLAANHRPAALIVESGFVSVPDLAAGLYPWLPVRLLSRFRYDTAGAMARAECPVLIVHSPEDEIVPYAQGRALFDRAREPKRFLELRGGHNEGFLASGASYTEGLDAFLTSVLGR